MTKTTSILFLLLFSALLHGALLAQSETSYGPVAANETLYRIALKYRQPGVTIAQTMMAIFNANPQAFDQGNINRLKKGATLKIPDAATSGALDRRQAFEDTTRQIDTYEQQVRELRTQRGEAEPLPQAAREPDLETGIEIETAVTEVDSEQVEEIKQELEQEQQQSIAQQGGQLVLPEPKPPKRQKKKKSKGPGIRYSYDVSVIDDDNVRLAQNDEDIRGDLIFSPTIKARGGRSIDSFTIWNYGASATYSAFDTFDELDNFEFDINTRYRFALTSGFTSPIFSLGAKIGGAEYESEMRDATRLALSAELNRWITDTVNMTAGVGYRVQESKSDVYDTSDFRVFVNFDTEFGKSNLIYTTLAFSRGDIVSSATPSLGIINAAEAIEPDDAFGGQSTNQFAYRLDAETWVLTLGYNRIMTRSLSIDLSARFVDSEATEDDELGYERTIVRASLLGRF